MLIWWRNIFLSNGAFCSIKGRTNSSFREGFIQDDSEEVLDYGHWYMGQVELDGEMKNTVFIKSIKRNFNDYSQWLYLSSSFNKPVLFDREPGKKEGKYKFITQIKLTKIQVE